ncbi:MAG: ATP-binding cassette, subfamily bacterial [Acidimicrobiia bacterium]|jgi:ATP-binding cassette subfamily B protein|nr:ATP-binding cassette, subfamily bacterial [Acidimicrobiia bacterium]
MYHWYGYNDPDKVKGRKLQRGLLRRVWGHVSGYRLLITGFLATVVLGSLVGLANPLVIRLLLNDAIPHSNRGQVNVLAGLLVAATALGGVLSLIGRYWSSRIGEGLIFDLRTALYEHVQRMPISFFTNSQTGSLTSRLNSDVVGAQRAVTGTLGTAVDNVVSVVTTLAAMLLLDWRLSLLALAVLPLFLLGSKRVGRTLRAITREGMQHNAAMSTQMTERFGVAGAQLVTLFGRHDDERQSFAERAGRVRDIGIRSALVSRTFWLGLEITGAIGVAAVYWAGSQFVIGGSFALGDLVAMGLLVNRVYEPLIALTNLRVDVLTAFVSFERVFEVLDAPNPIVDKPGASRLDRPAGTIELDHVSFTYPAAAQTTLASLTDGMVLSKETAPVLHDVTARIEPGQLVALVGPSGAGKTTLAGLIPRLYDVNSGSLRVDGVDVRDLTLDSLRESIGVVSQDPHLFHDTVAANLRYARPDASDDELARVSRMAQIHEVIANLPEGYDTVVGDRGYRLSGGEKQRLAIARMLLKDPAIVILDEATSHLDSENEAAIQRALDTALHGRTAVVIAHRLSTIVDADQILVMDEGRIVEHGRHQELLAAGGLYAELYHTLVRTEVERVEEIGASDIAEAEIRPEISDDDAEEVTAVG